MTKALLFYTRGIHGRHTINSNLKSEKSDDFNVSKNSSSAAGRLKNCLNYWFHGLNAMDFVLDIIKIGYMLPFHHTPDSCHSEKQ